MSGACSSTEAPRARPSGVGVIVEVLESIEDLRTLIPDWEALAAEAAEPNPFYEHWMLLPALEAYGSEGFRCVAAWDNGVLGALFPMTLERRYRGLPVPVLRAWRHRNMLLSTPLLRAKSAADCGADQWFECKLGVYEGEPVNVDCVCSMIASTGCECLRGETVSCEEPNKLCSCAVTGILVK